MSRSAKKTKREPLVSFAKIGEKKSIMGLEPKNLCFAVTHSPTTPSGRVVLKLCEIYENL